jgi:hypothetical protein
MRTIKKVQQLRLTSHSSRRDEWGHMAGDDAAGFDWYLYPGRGIEDADERPRSSLCVACGLGVDRLHYPHWRHATDHPYGDLWAHDSPKCVKLVFPRTA